MTKMKHLKLKLAQLFFVGLTLFLDTILGAWQDGLDIKSKLRRDEIQVEGSFFGHPEDHLSLLQSTTESFYVGGKDTLWNLSARNLKPLNVLNWTVSSHHRDQCQIKGQPDSACYNFVRVFHGPLPLDPHSQRLKERKDERRTTTTTGTATAAAMVASASLLNENSTTTTTASPKVVKDDEVFILCGTNAFKPTCRYYSLDLKNHTLDFSGVGYSAFDPTHPSTSLLHHGSVYTGTVADFGGTDALIYKNPLRTEQNDLKHLNSPAFVSSLSYQDFALFFFREFAIEHSNCGKIVFSRVARICHHDHGSKKHKDRFTTFLKARLNCSVPGEYPFYFDHIRGTTDMFMDGDLGQEMLYAVFTTAPNSIGGSAVCAFTAQDIMKAFEGPFKGQTSYNSNWLPVPSKDLPQQNLGSCSNDPDKVPNSNSVAFLKAHPLMDENVQGRLVLTQPRSDLFTAIEVDHSSNILPYHIIYLGTDAGKVIKSVVNGSRGGGAGVDDREYRPDESVISQSWDVFPGIPIKTIRLVSSKRLLVATETKMVIIRVDNCDKFQHCSRCLEIRDPHCAWDVDHQKCVPKDPEVSDKELPINLIQDVTAGDIHLCPNDQRYHEANHLKSINEQEDLSMKLKMRQQQPNQGGEECCSCNNNNGVDGGSNQNGAAAAATPLNSMGHDDEGVLTKDKDLGDLNQLEMNSSHHHHHHHHHPQNHSSFLDDNEIPRQLNNNQQDFKSSYVKSEEGTVSSHSVVLATTSSAILSLLIGFALGFIACKWLAVRHNKTKDTSSNAQIAANEAQRLTTKPIDFVVNVPTANKNPLKNNLNTETLEKTVKKMYI